MTHTSVQKTGLPAQSLLHTRFQVGDFLDCYRVASTLPPREAAGIIVDFPGWARWLVALRNLITAPFGLMADGPDSADKLGLFPVELETDSEVIAGFNDRHLDFRVSVLSTGGHVHLATWVHPNKIGGRLYLAAIMPFHIMIARNALARVAGHTAPPPDGLAEK
ncbi:DUF2867 domain-containing protein [uncultured Roseobacter sp.]|uniref:DUF2867 domain-containing protein n=1 Tax=uncultured Roseobacter sp. TaxID=114847 RepID=UPI00261CC1D9|nr:DUF2867 domain-containing protein [uncultured Roseobacter sp.]